MRENEYQRQLIKKLKKQFPGCVIMKNDAQLIQGILDLTILYNDKWAMLEVKASAKSKERPNQDYYVRQLDDMSFAAFIYPENEEEILNALQQAFASGRRSRIPQS
jgi:3-hydroxymyristoyl/3-hydroxydecanoyl-(acyl carrier protein) dehydratase